MRRVALHKHEGLQQTYTIHSYHRYLMPEDQEADIGQVVHAVKPDHEKGGIKPQ